MPENMATNKKECANFSCSKFKHLLQSKKEFFSGFHVIQKHIKRLASFAYTLVLHT